MFQISLSRKKAIGRSKDLPTVFSFQKSKASLCFFFFEEKRGCFRFFAGERYSERYSERYIWRDIFEEIYVEKMFSLFRGDSEYLGFFGRDRRSKAFSPFLIKKMKCFVFLGFLELPLQKRAQANVEIFFPALSLSLRERETGRGRIFPREEG